ncbi:MAG: YhcH/YjgK/YiaL family protein [Pseudomonadota bacterium]
MIVDSLKNIELYKNISADIVKGLEFLKETKDDIELGEYQITQNVKAIVSEYKTKEIFERGFEAHKRAIDIQYPICGQERVKWSPIDKMDVNIEYDHDKDRTFFKNPSQNTVVDIGNQIFAIFFPDDGHSPQHFIKEPSLIKKITIKVKI